MSSLIGRPEELLFVSTLQNYIPSDDWNKTEETPSVETQNKVTKTLVKITFFKHRECGESLPEKMFETLFENNATTRCPCCSKTASKVNFSSHNSIFYETLPSPMTAPVDNINSSKLRIKEIHSTIHNYLNAAQEDLKISNYEKAIIMTEMAIAEANKGLLIDNDDDYLNHLLCLLQILMGKIYQDQNENEKAQEYYGKSNQRIDEILSDSKQTVFQELELLTLQGNTYINLSNIDRLQNNLEKSSINLKKSLDCYKRVINNSRKSDQTIGLFKKCQ